MKKFIIPVLCLLVFSQCKKDSNKTGSNSFMPLTVGSNWTYTSSNAGTYTLTVTNKDTVAGTPSRTYKVLSSSDGNNAYYANEGTDHYRFTVLPGILPNGAAELYLKSGASVNNTWQLTVPVDVGFPGVTANLKYTIVEKGISKTVLGKNYTDVTNVALSIGATFPIPLPGIPTNFGGGNFFYAKGVGLIYSDLSVSGVPGQPAFSEVQELVSYQIK